MAHGKTLPFPISDSVCKACFKLVHIDVRGFAHVLSRYVYKHFITFIVDFSCCTQLHFFNTYTNVFCILYEFITIVENNFFATIKTLRSKSRGE